MKLSLGKNKNLVIAALIAGASFLVISRMLNKDTVPSPKTLTLAKGGAIDLGPGFVGPAKYDPNIAFPNPDVANDDIISTQNWGPPSSASYLMQPNQARPQVMNAYYGNF